MPLDNNNLDYNYKEKIDQNKYLVEMASPEGEFKSKDDLEEWCKCASFVKALNPKP